MKNIIFKVLSLFVLFTLIYSCYPDEDVHINDLDTVSTFYEDGKFEVAPTSAIIYWDVAQLMGDDEDDIPYNGQIDDEILNTTLDNLVLLYGVDNVYIASTDATPIPTPSNAGVVIITPDDGTPIVEVAVVPSIVLKLNSSASIIYPPCLPGWWGWFCYPPIIDVSYYSVGTVLLDMTDLRDGNLNSSWRAFMRGLLSSSESSNSTRTIDGINSAFDQSPYLN